MRPCMHASFVQLCLSYLWCFARSLLCITSLFSRMVIRASSSDLYVVQQLINDSVSLLVYSGSEGEGEEEGEESDGSLRSGAGEGGDAGGEKRGSGGSGRRRARPGGLGGSQGSLGRCSTEGIFMLGVVFCSGGEAVVDVLPVFRFRETPCYSFTPGSFRVGSLSNHVVVRAKPSRCHHSFRDGVQRRTTCGPASCVFRAYQSSWGSWCLVLEKSNDHDYCLNQPASSRALVIAMSYPDRISHPLVALFVPGNARSWIYQGARTARQHNRGVRRGLGCARQRTNAVIGNTITTITSCVFMRTLYRRHDNLVI